MTVGTIHHWSDGDFSIHSIELLYYLINYLKYLNLFVLRLLFLHLLDCLKKLRLLAFLLILLKVRFLQIVLLVNFLIQQDLLWKLEFFQEFFQLFLRVKLELRFQKSHPCKDFQNHHLLPRHPQKHLQLVQHVFLICILHFLSLIHI